VALSALAKEESTRQKITLLSKADSRSSCMVEVEAGQPLGRCALIADDSMETQNCQAKDCLSKNKSSPDKCDAQLFALYECCEKLYQAQAAGKPIDNTNCAQETVVKRWLKQHRKSSTP
ncbi:3223_t:CDS:2, partial [Acaulospora colombiana]